MAKRRFVYTDQMTMLSDKIAVRKYVSEKIGEKYLVPMLFEMDSLNQEIYNQIDTISSEDLIEIANEIFVEDQFSSLTFI